MKGAGRALLLAPVRSRGNGGPPGAGGPGPERSVLVVWEWRETVPMPPFCQV